MMSPKKLLVFVGILLLVIGVILVVLYVRTQQELRSRAEQSSTLSLTPQAQTRNVGDTISLDVMLDPGINIVSFVKLDIQFDATYLTPDANAFVANTNAFPSTFEGPLVENNRIRVALSTGQDPTKLITLPVKVGTIHLRLISNTNGIPTQIMFGPSSQVLSAGQTEQAAENVLSGTTPAEVMTLALTPTPTPLLTPTITPTRTPTPSPTITLTPTPSPTLIPGGTSLMFNLLLDGIGSAGDRVNPTQATLSNKNPLHASRPLVVTLFNTSDVPVGTFSGSMTYQMSSGSFGGTLDLGIIPQGLYIIRVKSDRYLTEKIGAFHSLGSGEFPMPSSALVAGDVNSDNKLNILDYNILLDCGYGGISPVAMTDPSSKFNSQFCSAHPTRANSDLNDNGIVGERDFNLYLRELSVRNGS